MSAGKIPAIVLAADRGPDDPLARAAGVSSKSLVPVAGIPMLERVVRALEASRFIDEILILHNIENLPTALPILGPWMRSGRIKLAPAGLSPAHSALCGVDVLGSVFPVLLTTSDHALLSTEMIDHFCDHSLATTADICVALTPAKLVQQKYPATRRTHLSFKDGAYVGSNLYTVMTATGLAAVEFWRTVERQRKRPWQMARLFGFRLLLGYLVRSWRMEEAVTKAGQRIGVSAAPVVMPFAEAAIDVDRPADLDLANSILSAAG